MGLLNERKWGVEIEFVAPTRFSREDIKDRLIAGGIKCVSKDGYASNYHENNRDHTRWCLAHDGSLQTPNGHCHELSSPPLVGEEGIKQLRKVLKVLKDVNAEANHTCGLHVHHEIVGSTDVNKLGLMFFQHQNAMYNIVDANRADNRYCRRLPSDYRRIVNTSGTNRDDRFYGLNFVPASRKHVEFRLHHGSVRFTEIRNWIILGQKLIERAEKSEDIPALNRVVSNILSTQMLTVSEIVRKVINSGTETTEADVKKVLKSSEFTAIETGDEVWYTKAVKRDEVESMIEELGLNGTDLEVFYIGRREVRRNNQHVNGR